MSICEYEDCQKEATDLVYSRKLDKVIETCSRHTREVVDEENPEYVETCPHCGCWIPIN